MNDNPMHDNLAIVVDGLGIITVPQEKGTLAIALIQHFTPDWIRMIRQGQAEGECMSAVDYVDACLTNLAVPHAVTKCPVAYMTVMEGLDTEDLAAVEEQIPEPAQTAQPGFLPTPEPMPEPAAEEPKEEIPPVNAEPPAEEPPKAEEVPASDPPMEPAPKEEPLQAPEKETEEGSAPSEDPAASDDLGAASVVEEPAEEKTPWD